MPFFSWKKVPSNNPLADGLASQSTQQPGPVCTWTAHAPQPGSSPLPFPRDCHTLTATATAAGELFLFGGYVHGCASSDLYVVSTRDFSSTLLQTSGAVPTPRYAHSAALIGTTLLICAGKVNFCDQDQPNHDSLYLLNLVPREWSHIVVNVPGSGRRYYHTTNVVGSKLFIFGGQIGGNAINDMWSLDLNCLKSQPLWESYEPTPGDEKPLPRRSHVSVTTEDRIIIFGGASGQHQYDDTWSFDISTRKWTELQCTGSIPSPRRGHAAVLVDDVMYVFGGFSTDKGHMDDLYALQLSTQRWFKFHNVGFSPHMRAYHTMASDGTRVFVLGGYSTGARSDETSLIHVFDTKDIKYPNPERNVVNPNEKITLLAQKSSPEPNQGQPRHQKSSSSEARYASRLQNVIPAVSGRPAFLQIIHEGYPGPNSQPLELMGVNSKPRCDPEDDVSEGSTEYTAKFEAFHSSSGEDTRLELERQLSVLLAAQTEQDRRIARLTDELALKSALLEQAEANAVEAARRAGSELREYVDDQRLKWTSLVKERDVELVDMQVMLRDTQARLDELLLSRDQQIGQHEREFTNVRAKLEAKESESEAVSLRVVDAEKDRTSLDELPLSRDKQVGQYERDLANVLAKLEAKESELEAVRLRLLDAEIGWTKSKAEADILRAQNATGSMNRDEDQVIHRLMERVRAIEAELASRLWNEKSVEEKECRNEG